MNLTQFFASDAVALPVGGFDEKRETFDVFLREVFDRYLVQMQDIADPALLDICAGIKRSLEVTTLLCDQIISSLVHHLAGRASLAYQEFDDVLANKDVDVISLSALLREANIRHLDTISLKGGQAFLEASTRPIMYRMRVPNSPVPNGLSREEIFHVPFELRHLVHNQRYSNAGLPCLYLGSSTWVCWEELGRPDLDKVFVSLFRFAEDVSVLDFHLPPMEAWARYQQVQKALKEPPSPYRKSPLVFLETYGPHFIQDYIRLWPLIAACAVKRSTPGSFHPQYIIPQMLLQWVCSEEKVDGIRYFSTRSTWQGCTHANLAFPTRNIKHTGRCSHLQKKFWLTNPLPWSILREINKHTDGLDPTLVNHEARINVAEGFPIEYKLTGFYEAECKLMNLEIEHRTISKMVMP
jgi:hypothetical protein